MLPRRMAGPSISPVALPTPARSFQAGRGSLTPGLPVSGSGAPLPSLPSPLYPQVGLNAPDNPMAWFAALLLGVYLALHACYMPEFMLVYFSFSFPIVAGTGILVAVLWLFIGRFTRFFETRIAGVFVLLLMWWLLAAAIHSFKGYFFDLVQYGIRFHATPLIICGLLLSLGLLRVTITTYALGFVVSLFLTWRYGIADSTGRFHVPKTSMANPNDLALNLLLGVTLMTVFLVDANLIKRVFWLCCTLASLYFMLRTGSRANLITLLVVIGAGWVISSGRVRVTIMAGAFLVLIVFAALVPHSNWSRLTTFFSASNEELGGQEHLEGAIGSTEARKNLQIRAIKITLLNPVFGIGPNMFTYALDDYMRTQESFAKGTWLHPHNTYLDISAETGLVGVGLYIAVMIWCLRTNYRNVRWAQLWSTGPSQALGISSALFLATVTFSFGTLFCSIPYTGQLPFLVGLTAANSLAMRNAGLQRYPVSPPRAPLSYGPTR